MNQPVSSLNLPLNIITKLENAGFYHCSDIPENCELINSKINIPNWASVTEAPQARTALEIYQEEDKPVRTQIPELDCILENQFVPGCVTELCGFPGTGKTQICLHLAVGVKGEVVFIHTNKNLNPGRLREIAHGDEDVMKRIFCIEATDPVELVASVHFLESWLPEHKPIKLLIIDSISWPLKQQAYTERTNLACTIFQNLRIQAGLHKFAIVVTNDLTTRLSGGKTYNTSSFSDSFYHLVNNRILLSKEGATFSAKVLKSISNDSPVVSFKF